MRLLILALFLVGCSTVVPVKQRFPEADPYMLEPAPALVTLPPDTTELDRLIANSADNYGKYRELVKRYELWQEWYKLQKQNFESAYK